jgi:hypothetical protein
VGRKNNFEGGGEMINWIKRFFGGWFQRVPSHQRYFFNGLPLMPPPPPPPPKKPWPSRQHKKPHMSQRVEVHNFPPSRDLRDDVEYYMVEDENE